MKRLVLTLLVGLILSPCLSAQTPASPQETYPGGERVVQESAIKHNQQGQQQPALNRPMRETRILKQGLLAPSEQDRLDHQLFLTQPNTGLIRLLPREVYDWRVYKTTPQIDLRGGGAYYSFAFLSHEYGWGSDIELDHDRLSSGFAGVDLGILTNIGDVPLDSLSIDDPKAVFLASYNPPPGEPEAREQFIRISNGFTWDGMEYRRTLQTQVNSTYLVRSVVYDRSDVLVAFRVVRKDENGSVVIAWKLLKKYPVTQLSR